MKIGTDYCDEPKKLRLLVGLVLNHPSSARSHNPASAGSQTAKSHPHTHAA